MINKNRLTISDNLNEEDSLFRYMPLAQFISMMEDRKLYLKSVRSWEDPWEIPDDQLPGFGVDGKPLIAGLLIEKSTVGQCWTLEKDSDAMWRIYSQDKQGVMVETTIKNFGLINNLRHACLSKVIYYCS